MVERDDLHGRTEAGRMKKNEVVHPCESSTVEVRSKVRLYDIMNGDNLDAFCREGYLK